MRTAVLLAGALLLAACGSGLTGPRYRVATGIATENRNDAALSGLVHGRTNDDGTACFWIAYSGKPGTSPGRVAIVWPHGSRAYAHPLRVVSADGDVIATVGSSVSLPGAPARRERCAQGPDSSA